ncbi:MAG: DinB family protein [Phycisphaerales bacterium]
MPSESVLQPSSRHAQAINQFESLGPKLRTWFQGLSREQLLSHPVPGKWSMQELVVHLYDSDIAATHRMRRIAAEDTPLLIAYDESRFIQRLDHSQTDLKLVADLFDMNRRFTAAWLRTLPEESFERVGIHNQRGKITLGEMVNLYIAHFTGHEKFAMEKRRALGVA